MEKKPWEVMLGILGGGVPPGSPNSDLFQTKKYGYSHPFQTCPVRNKVIFTQIGTATKKIC